MTCGAGDWCTLPQEMTRAIRLQTVHPSLLLVVKIAKDIIAHCNDVGRWWWRQRRRERKIYHDRIYNNQMVALVNGSGTNYAEQKWVWSLSMWTILAVGDAIATTGESWNKEFWNEWNGLYCFL